MRNYNKDDSCAAPTTRTRPRATGAGLGWRDGLVVGYTSPSTGCTTKGVVRAKRNLIHPAMLRPHKVELFVTWLKPFVRHRKATSVSTISSYDVSDEVVSLVSAQARKTHKITKMPKSSHENENRSWGHEIRRNISTESKFSMSTLRCRFQLFCARYENTQHIKIPKSFDGMKRCREVRKNHQVSTNSSISVLRCILLFSMQARETHEI